MTGYERDVAVICTAVGAFAALVLAGELLRRKMPASALSYPSSADRLRHINPHQEV